MPPHDGGHGIGRSGTGSIRRNTTLLAFAQGFVQTTFPVMLAIGGPAASRISGRDGAAGFLWRPTSWRRPRAPP